MVDKTSNFLSYIHFRINQEYQTISCVCTIWIICVNIVTFLRSEDSEDITLLIISHGIISFYSL